jgi:hypothetical protein
MTSDEIDILSPSCAKCIMPAMVVERQMPFSTDAERAQPLVQAAAIGNLHKFYCAWHTTLDVPTAVFDRAEDMLLQMLSTYVRCEKRSDRRYASVCVHYMPSCLKRCQPIKALLRGIDVKAA